jgi:hypothetical protein
LASVSALAAARAAGPEVATAEEVAEASGPGPAAVAVREEAASTSVVVSQAPAVAAGSAPDRAMAARTPALR